MKQRHTAEQRGYTPMTSRSELGSAICFGCAILLCIRQKSHVCRECWNAGPILCRWWGIYSGGTNYGCNLRCPQPHRYNYAWIDNGTGLE